MDSDMSTALVHCRRRLPAALEHQPRALALAEDHDATPVRLHKVHQARERLACGHYDDPRILDAALGRLLDVEG
jgi:hypothetical protein